MHQGESHRAFTKHDNEEHGEHVEGRFNQNVPVKEHPHTDEEEHREGVLEGEGFRSCTVRETRLTHHCASEECPQGETHVEDVRSTISHAHGNRQNKERKEFSRTSARNFTQSPRKNTFADNQHHRGKGTHVKDRDANLPEDFLSARRTATAPNKASHDRQEYQNQHGSDIFHNEPTHSDLTVHGIQNPTHFQGFNQHHG